MKKALEVAEKCLRELSTNRVSHGRGICYLVEDALYASGASSAECYFIGFLLKGIMASWHRFSGNFLFPVPSTNAKKSASEAYSDYQLWGCSHYGNYRRELAKYTADRLSTHSEYFSSNSFWVSFLNDLDWMLAVPSHELGDRGVCRLIWRGEEGTRARYVVLIGSLHCYDYYSGDLHFPVAHPSVKDPLKAFEENELWEGEYGRRRIVLLLKMREFVNKGCELTANHE
jgi:hypothetical protein